MARNDLMKPGAYCQRCDYLEHTATRDDAERAANAHNDAEHGDLIFWRPMLDAAAVVPRLPDE